MAAVMQTEMDIQTSESQVLTNDDDEGDESSSDDDQQICEPKLKYDRISNDVTSILSRDAASCMTVHSKFIALGTHWGWIHILDHAGNDIRGKEFAAHSTTVNQISIDNSGDFIASCSDDGKVVVTGLYTEDSNMTHDFDRPIKAVALDPAFSKKGSTKSYVSGNDRLVLIERGFLPFLRNKGNMLHHGEGPIRSIKWQSVFIAWANDHGVKVYDTSSKSRITSIAKDHEFRPDLYRCNLCWKNDTTLLVGWANKVSICIVKDRVQKDIRDLPSRYVEIVCMFDNEFFICGLAPLDGNVVILGYEQEEEQGERYVAARPHLQIMTTEKNSYKELASDLLSIRGFQDYRCNDYHLENVAGENNFYIVSPKDIVMATPCDHDYRITWLLERERYEEAMVHVTEHRHELKKHTLQGVGKQYLSSLLEREMYDDGARFCVKILGKDKQLWEEEVFEFAEIKQLKAIAPYLPRGEPTLSPTIYEMVLNEYLQSDHKTFLKFIKEWPSHLYNIQTLVKAVLERLDRYPGDHTLLCCLAQLYTYERRFDKTLEIFLRLQHEDIFHLIYKYNLFDTIINKLNDLLFDPEQTLKLLLENVDKIPIDSVVKQLKVKPEILHRYLHSLFLKEPHMRHDYHILQLTLYAEYDPSNLIYFLRTSSNYPLSAALKMCDDRDLSEERVYLLGRMGQTKQALELITNRLKNVERAIDFCKEHDDEELWEDLITFSMDKPKFITGLLQNIGTHVDPIILIQRIQPGREIPGLRDSLVKIMQDYNLQISLREGCRKILIADSFNLLNRQVKLMRRGISVSGSQLCAICQQPLMSLDMRYVGGEVIVFFCRHAFHEDCLSSDSTDSCAICKTQKRGPAPPSLVFRK